MKSVTITTVVVSGSITIDPRAVEQKVQSLLNEKYFFFVPKRFTYTYPRDAITTAIERISHVARATVTRTSRTALSIAIVEYTPSALWCADAENNQTTVSEECLYVSEEGFAFAKAPSLKGTTFLRYVTEGRAPEVGATLMPAERARAIQAFTHTLLLRHTLYISVIKETPDGDVRYQVRGGGVLLIAKDDDMQKVSENLDAILASAEFKHIKAGNFDYIDLRFGDKVFVKKIIGTEQ